MLTPDTAVALALPYPVKAVNWLFPLLMDRGRCTLFQLGLA